VATQATSARNLAGIAATGLLLLAHPSAATAAQVEGEVVDSCLAPRRFDNRAGQSSTNPTSIPCTQALADVAAAATGNETNLFFPVTVAALIGGAVGFLGPNWLKQNGKVSLIILI
jgi:hypothetical protein